MKNALLAGCTLLSLAIITLDNANAVEPQSSVELESHCAHYRLDPDGKNGIPPDTVYITLRKHYPRETYAGT